MKKEYDFSKMKGHRNPYAKKLKKQVADYDTRITKMATELLKGEIQEGDEDDEEEERFYDTTYVPIPVPLLLASESASARLSRPSMAMSLTAQLRALTTEEEEPPSTRKFFKHKHLTN